MLKSFVLIKTMSPIDARDEPQSVGGGNCECNLPCQPIERSEAANAGSGVGSIEIVRAACGENRLNGLSRASFASPHAARTLLLDGKYFIC